LLSEGSVEGGLVEARVENELKRPPRTGSISLVVAGGDSNAGPIQRGGDLLQQWVGSHRERGRGR